MKQKKEAMAEICLKGIRPLMFDRYQSNEKTLPEEKLYLDENNGLVIPSRNIRSFLCGTQTISACRVHYGKNYKAKAILVMAYIDIEPLEIPIMRDGKQIVFEGFGKNSIDLVDDVARVKGNVPNPITRPMINLPWGITFRLTLFPNTDITKGEIEQLFDKPGIVVGLGTYRGLYGKFQVKSFEWRK